MGTTEWILLVLVFLIPLLIAVPVTLWSLEQARKRSKPSRTDRIRRRVDLPETAGRRDGGTAGNERVEESKSRGIER